MRLDIGRNDRDGGFKLAEEGVQKIEVFEDGKDAVPATVWCVLDIHCHVTLPGLVWVARLSCSRRRRRAIMHCVRGEFEDVVAVFRLCGFGPSKIDR